MLVQNNNYAHILAKHFKTVQRMNENRCLKNRIWENINRFHNNIDIKKERVIKLL